MLNNAKKEKNNALKISILTLFACIAGGILIYHQVKEYLRYEEIHYQYLYYFFYYGSAVLIMIYILAKGLGDFLRKKTLFNTLPFIILVISILSAFSINNLTQDFPQHIIHTDGLSIDSLTGKVLDGTYKSSSDWDGVGGGEHCSKHLYSYKGDMIHSGEYLQEENLKQEIIAISESKIVLFDLWQEGGYEMLTVSLIQPQKSNPTTVDKISKKVIFELKNKYKFKTLYIQKSDNGNYTELAKVKLD